MDIFKIEMEKGLDSMTNHESDLKMLPTFVCDLPTGKENGDFLVIDLGGSNFRVVLIRLRPNSEPEIENKAFILFERLLRGTGDEVK